MPRITTRASLAARPDDDDVRQLDQARQQNDQKLKSRFERIFRKYEHNFEGVGDEIDIHSGEIVVDNGHLQHMRDEADPGKSASSRFVRTFQEKLEHEGEGEGDDDGVEDGSERGDDDEDEDSISENGNSDGDNPSNDSQSTIEPFRALNRPPPRLAQLLVGGTRAVEDIDDQTSQDPSLAEDGSGTATPIGLLEQIPALQGSMSALTGRSRRTAVDAHTIQALGTTIANQLAQLMAGPSKEKTKKPQSKSRRSATDPVWDFPDIEKKINNKRQPKRKRSPHPVLVPPISSPPLSSPGQRSLWAPEGSRQSKRFKEAATPSLKRLRSSVIPSSAVRGSELKRCMNCSFTNSPAWQTGPGGGDLCVSCGKYYDHHGRMKPFDSPTPSVEEQDSSAESLPEIDMREHFIASIDVTDEDIPMEHVSANGLHEAPPQVPVEHDYMPTPPSAHNDSSEVMTVQPAVSHVVPDHTATNALAPAPKDIFEPECTRDLTFLLETPGTYKANTSRQLLTGTRSGLYSAEEDAFIIRLKEQYELPWHVVALQLPQRSLFSIQNRYTRALHNTDCAGRDLFNEQQHGNQDTDAIHGRLVLRGQELNWNYEQDELLLHLREEKDLQWAEIASVLPGHSPPAVEARYEELVLEVERRREQHLGNPCKAWSAIEDARIVRLKEVDKLAWHHVAERVENRSMQSIQKRYSRLLAPQKRKRAPGDLTQGTSEELILEVDPELAVHIAPGWRKEPPYEPVEDQLIKRHVEEAEYLDWAEVAAHLPGRSIRSVYARYTGFINKEVENPGLKNSKPEIAQPMIAQSSTVLSRTHSPVHPSIVRRTDTPPHTGDYDISSSAVISPTFSRISAPESWKPFLQAEDDIIMQLKAFNNASWENISLQLPGRSANDVAQRFSEILRAMPTTPTNTQMIQPASNPSQLVSTTPHPKLYTARLEVRRYTQEEDDLIVTFRADGMSWEAMAPHFKGRMPDSLKEHFNSKLQPRARQSLPAPTNARAGLLRTALDNSRRRSDARPKNFKATESTGYGNVEDPIMFEDDVEMAAASQQLSTEFRSSVVHEPFRLPQIDPQLLELDRVASKSRSLWRLILAAERFAVEQNNPHIVQQINQVYQRNADDPTLQQLLHLTSQGGSHVTPELEWAFEAFYHAHRQPERTQSSFNTAPERVPEILLQSTREKGKGKARERDTTPQSLHPPAPAQTSRSTTNTTPRQSKFQETTSPHVPIRSDTVAPASQLASKLTRTPWPHVTTSGLQTSTLASPIPHIVPSDSNGNDVEPHTEFLLAKKTAKIVPPKQAAANAVPRSNPAGHRRNGSTAALEHSCAALSRPQHLKGRSASLSHAEFDDEYAFPRSEEDIDGYEDVEEPITVKPPNRKRGRPRGKRATKSVRDSQEYVPVTATQKPPAARRIPTRRDLGGLSKLPEVEKALSTPSARGLDLTIVIADSDGGIELSSSPAQKLRPRAASSGKKVRFVETVEVRGPARASVADPTLSPKKSSHTVDGGGSNTRELDEISSSPAKVQGTSRSIKDSGKNVNEAVPSSSPVFMKPAIPKSNITSKPTTTSMPMTSVSTPFPRAKSRLSQLRRESTSTVAAAPETPKTNWPRRHSTPTAIFSHRASPALGRGVMIDRFGYGRKRVVETPMRELMKKKDLEEDELA